MCLGNHVLDTLKETVCKAEPLFNKHYKIILKLLNAVLHEPEYQREHGQSSQKLCVY